MEILYDSRTGNCQYVAQKLGELLAAPVKDASKDVPNGVFLLVTHTYGKAKVTNVAMNLLAIHANDCRGLIVSGDSRWGDAFGIAGDMLQAVYGVPVLAKLEVRGFSTEYEALLKTIKGGHLYV